VRSFHLKIAGREEGPYGELQIAQMFADGRVDRNTPCKPADQREWKTIDNYLPMLKYGTQLPTPSRVSNMPPKPPPALPLSAQPVSVVDFDIPFWSLLKIMFKWMAAGLIVGLCLMPVVIVVWLIVMALFAAFLGGVHHP